MLRQPGRSLRIIASLFFVVSPFVIHFLLARQGNDSGVAGAALLLLQGMVIAILVGTRMKRRFRLLAVAAVLASTLLLSLSHVRGGLVLAAGAPHAAIYLGLLTVFARSLFPGHEPVITFFARTIHGQISPEIEKYTRRVTSLWCGFFLLQLVGSAVLLKWAPIAWWSVFVNILNLPLVASLLLGEKLGRPLWVADPPREYLRDFLRLPMLLRQRGKKLGIQPL
jgi:uncharacterized membrane protein